MAFKHRGFCAAALFRHNFMRHRGLIVWVGTSLFVDTVQHPTRLCSEDLSTLSSLTFTRTLAPAVGIIDHCQRQGPLIQLTEMRPVRTSILVSAISSLPTPFSKLITNRGTNTVPNRCSYKPPNNGTNCHSITLSPPNRLKLSCQPLLLRVPQPCNLLRANRRGENSEGVMVA